MITLGNIELYFGERCLFNKVSYQINQGDKIGLVGKNGAGKSTLLRLISGKIKPDGGQVAFSKGLKLGYLEQDLTENNQKPLLEYVVSGKSDIQSIQDRIDEIGNILATNPNPNPALYDELSDLHMTLDMNNASSAEEEAERVLAGLGFQNSDRNRPLDEFSGGWQMRAVLAKLLIDNPDVLLLDEPTNHLDIHSIYWLEKYLQTFKGALVLISHDRTFLDNCVHKIVDINLSKLLEYKCNYSQFLVRRVEMLEQNKREYQNQQKDIEKTQILINKFRAKKNKAAFAQSLIKKLDKMDKVELAEQDNSKIALRFPQPERSGKVVLKASSVAKSYDEHQVLIESDVEIIRGQKLAFVGANGSGKSTFIKMVNGVIQYSGDIELGHNVKLGYFAQDSQDELDPKKTVFETIDDIAVGDVRKQVRSILGSFLFGGEDVEKKVSVLSGGERTRLALCKLMLQPYNFLILDEPTNHLDILSKDILCDALKAFEGTVLVVSHDREFVGNLTNHLLHIADKRIKEFHYGIQEYLDKFGDQYTAKKTETKKDVEASSENGELNYKERKKLKNRVAKLERDIAKYEEELKEVRAKLGTNEFVNDKSLQERSYELDILIEQALAEWEEGSESLEQ